MKNYAIIIGIDISKLKLDVIGINPNAETVFKHQIIDNKKVSINSLLKKLVKKHGADNILIAFENTGTYGYFLALCLDKMKMDYCNLSALEIHKSTGIKRGKSDKMDALVIANYALVNRFK